MVNRHALTAASGLRASRSQSPSRLTARTSRLPGVPPGKITIHHSPENRKSWPMSDQRAERGLGRRHADAQEGQRRLGEDGQRQVDGGDHQHRSHDVGQHVAHHDLRSDARRRSPRRLDVLLVLLDHGRAAHGAGELHPGEAKPMANHQHVERRARRVDRAAARCAPTPSISRAIRMAGKVSLHVGDAHDDRVDRAADIAGDQPQRDAENGREAAPRRTDQERDARPVQDGREDVAALVVGAQQEPCAVAARPPRPAE